MIQIGGIYQTSNYGDVEVIDKNKSDYYTVRFLNTGTEKAFRSWQINEGCIRDPFAKKICGVACTGNVKTKGRYKPFYSIWHDMIGRCYDPNNKRYFANNRPVVSDRWLVFENFYKDMSLIDGFNEAEIVNGNLVLDKDLKQRRADEKVYSVETCTWVTKSENSSVQDRQQREFVGISPSGERFESDNISKFAREHGLKRRLISGVLHGRTNSTAGWKFYYKEEIV